MHGTLPALPVTIRQIVEEYQAKESGLSEAIATFDAAVSAATLAASIQGTYSHYDMFGRSGQPRIDERATRKALLVSGWRAIYSRLNIDQIASATDRKLFEQAVANPAPLTIDNVRATFEKYLLNPRFHILRGLAECFCDLDPAYKSHSKVKIGVKGLPKRIILSAWGEYGTGWGADLARDVFNAIAAYRGEEFVQPGMMHRIHDDTRNGREVTFHDITVRRFQNGNAHLIFEKQALLDINRALAEFYGDVLPDVEPEGAEKRPGTEVSKNLQYYPSPAAVIDEALHRANIATREEFDRAASYGRDLPRLKVLEPSCGDGRIMDEIRARGHSVFGIEYHAGRAADARAKGHSVLTANFLDCPAREEFDLVVMNPPFYGRHYVKHVRHAMKFLKPGGQLVAILPATAYYDHGDLADLMKPRGAWSDLPVASFAECGTNVPTGILKVWKPEARA